MLIGLIKKIFFLSLRGMTQFLTYIIIYLVGSSKKGFGFHFIKLFTMTVNMGYTHDSYKKMEMKAQITVVAGSISS